MYFTTSIAVVAGLCLAFGILYFFVGLRRRSQRRLNVLFASFSLAYASAIMGARTSYMADTVDQFATGAQVGRFFGAIAFTLLAWFVAEYTSVRPRVLLYTVSAAFALVAVATIFFPNLVVDISGGVGSVTLPWGETILMNEVQGAPLLALILVAVLAVVIYIVVADIIQFRRGDRRDAAVLAVGIGWFVFTVVQEALAELEVIDFVFLSDFGFLGFVLAMSLASTNLLLETEEELRDYRANLETMVADRTARLEAAQTQLLERAEEEAAAAERSRLARDLHDVVTQLLFSINLVAGSLPRLWRNDPDMAERSTEEVQRMARGALAEMRTLLRELRPHSIPETDLGTLVTQLTDGLAARHDIPADIRTNINGDLPPKVHLALYRIAQEAMNNVGRHANASSLVVDLTGDDGQIHLSVTDDGYGFDPSDVSQDHMGLEIMRERAAGIGADLNVTSEPGAGTTVDVTWSAHG